MIVTKYYDKTGKLKTLKPNTKIDKIKNSIIRFKVLNNNEFPCCDMDGICTNKAYAEVFPSLLKVRSHKKGWSYLCKKHYYEEQNRLNWKLPACLKVEW